MNRTLANNTPECIGEKVLLKGWVQNRREHGNVFFLDLKDVSGLVQVVFSEDCDCYKEAKDLGSQWIIAVEGKVRKRPEGMHNPRLDTGQVEVAAQKLEVLSQALPPSFDVKREGYNISEEKRLKERYLDLRRPRLQENLKTRSRITRRIREFLYKKGFTEIETPYLSKSTPEGARDFLVPSRLHPGKFYALAQAPQQYKQLLMMAGLERYFQIARAFRDEDLRADRQFEHTQVDLEASFVKREDVMGLVEEMIINLFESLPKKKIQKKPFPVLTYKEATEKYKTDRPDLRKDKEDKNLFAFGWVVDFPLFERAEDDNLTFSHNPFAAPKKEDVEKLLKEKDLESLQSYQYDLICNGHEIGGGSIRIREPEVQKKVFEILGYSEEEMERDFGHFLKALKYGCPPHGGIALGLDRLVAVICGEKNIREVIAFPVTSSGISSVMDAPTKVDPEKLKELHIEITEE